VRGRGSRPAGAGSAGAVDADPGVPEAEGRALAELLSRVPAERVDALWRFPPLRRGRRESGLLAAALLPDPEVPPEAPARHTLVTLAWRAEETGKGVTFEVAFEEEGAAPPELLPRVMTGVTRRMDEAAGEPRYLSVGGDPALLDALREELEP
jgi:hypothetical protein